MLTSHEPNAVATPRWLHCWSVVTLIAVLVLLGLGAAVTNFKAGMADPIWPTSPTALLHATSEQLTDVRWLIEHSHRLAGYLVGCCAILLTLGLWSTESRRWLCWLGTAALAGVCLQGIVGGLRVIEHARWGLELRIVHGAFAQVVFGLLVAVAVMTSHTWSAASSVAVPERLRRACWHTALTVFIQIVLGVWLRHTYHPVAQRLHLILAFAVFAGIVLLTTRLLASGSSLLRKSGQVLFAVLALQIIVGVEAWFTQLNAGTVPELLPVTASRVAIRTAHVLGGAILFGTTLTVALLTGRAGQTALESPHAGLSREAA